MAQRERKFVCVEHPAKVENVDRMLESLGGIEKISETYSNPSHRLELYFRPRDGFSKAAYGDRLNTTNILLKVTRKKGNSEFTSEILGFVKTTYKFQSLCDFQYLQMKRDETEVAKSISEELLPKKLESLNWLDKESPLFIPPPVFTRLDNAGDYYFRKNPTQKKETSHSEISPDIINPTQCLRQRRTLFSVTIPFEEPTVPSCPQQAAIENFANKLASGEMLQTVRELFDERPIWPRNAVLVNTKFRLTDVKILLPVVAYSFTSGPWRSLWIRFGYDPRKDTTSKIYQTLDFRVRQTRNVNINIQSKRSSCFYVLPNKINQSGGRLPLIQSDPTSAQESHPESDEEKWQRLENTYRFRPNICPPVRRVFYQFCDVDVPEVRQLVSSCVSPAICHERHGWLDNSVYEECRTILFNIVQELCKEIEKDKDENKDETVTNMDVT